MNTRIIIFEGIPGSGKTTTSQLLHRYLMVNGIDSRIFIEGSKHPIDLPFHAYLSSNEFKELLFKDPLQADRLREHSIIEEDYALIPYEASGKYSWSEAFVEYLRSKEFCYSSKAVVPFFRFKEVFHRRFEQFVSSAIGEETVTIMESVLFQHQIHDINRLYPRIDEVDIVSYIRELACILGPLNPLLFYLSQSDVKEALEHTARIRSKPRWSNTETIEYYIQRKNTELNVINHLPFRSVIVDNTDQNWDNMFETILKELAIS